MKKKRAGIFDPWRQEEAPKPPPPSLEEKSRDDVEEPERLHCVQYRGRTAGINVWVDEREANHALAARARLIDAVYRLHAHPLAGPTLDLRGVRPGRSEDERDFHLSDGERWISIRTGRSDTEHIAALAIDVLALVFRAIMQKSAGDVLVARNIKPYVT